MKKLLKFLTIATICAMASTSCSTDNAPELPSRLPDNAMVYINVDVLVPRVADAQTRQADNATPPQYNGSHTSGTDTSSDGSEDGTDNENRIYRALIILKGANGNTNNLFAAVSDGKTDDNGKITLTARIPLKEALEFGKNAKGDYSLYLIANYQNDNPYFSVMKGDYNVDGYSCSIKGLDDPYLSDSSASYGLPMSNFEEYNLTISDDWNEDFFLPFISEDSPLNLNEKYNTGKPLQLERGVARIDYADKDRSGIAVGDTEKSPHTYKIGDTGYVVRIVGMLPVNVSRNFFTFRHILNGETPDFLGRETDSNFFLDTDDNVKKGDVSQLSSSHFINQGNSENRYPDSFESVFDNGNDKYPFKKSTNPDKRIYTPWRYLSENTITDPLRQLQAFSTAILFKAEILQAPENAPDGRKVGENLFYYHFIRHNDNGNPDVMGPMEFGVVRNNIYKLSIECISSLPRPYNPEDPDEPKDADMVIKTMVKRWNYHKIIFDL